jgi:periplasmic protein TonB
MSNTNLPVTKTNRRLFAGRPSPQPDEPKQRRMMVAALTLLLISLGFVLYRDRDFWFPDTPEADVESQTQPAAATAVPSQAASPRPVSPAHRKSRGRNSEPTSQAKSLRPVATPADAASSAASTPPVSITRTVLPPLEVEVVAGDNHRTVRPGTNSVRVDLEPGTSSRQASEAAAASPDTAAGVTTNAAEHVQISADTAEVVSRPVKPGYPLLARQMKVQGSVILQAMIGRDGLIQDLHVVSGPPILASAAQEAVKQWHFKPHFEGAGAVETQAKITVNFTISTN